MAYEVLIEKFTPDEPDGRVDIVLPDEVVAIGEKAFRFTNEVRSICAWEMPHSTAAETLRKWISRGM